MKKANGNRRASKNNILESFTDEELQQKLKKTKGICPKCKKDVGIKGLQLDHIYPISKASEDFKNTGKKRIYIIEDIQPLCRVCNSSKGNKIL